MQTPSAPSATHPKICVENKKDIIYLKQEMMKFAKSVLSEFNLNPHQEPEHAEEEIMEKLEKWIEMIFEMASDSIEINGLPYHEAFELEQEYEPLNEELRQQADELHNQIQESLVKLSGFRKMMPQQLEQLNSETLKIISKSAEDAIIEPVESVEESQKDSHFVALQPVSLDNFDSICRQQKELSTILPDTLKKAQDIENLLNDLKVPALGAPVATKTKEELDKQSRRRSSLGKVLLSANYLNASESISSAHQPQKAAEALVKRLQMETRKQSAMPI